jgi:hypothetical protein
MVSACLVQTIAQPFHSAPGEGHRNQFLAVSDGMWHRPEDVESGDVVNMPSCRTRNSRSSSRFDENPVSPHCVHNKESSIPHSLTEVDAACSVGKGPNTQIPALLLSSDCGSEDTARVAAPHAQYFEAEESFALRHANFEMLQCQRPMDDEQGSENVIETSPLQPPQDDELFPGITLDI